MRSPTPVPKFLQISGVQSYISVLISILIRTKIFLLSQPCFQLPTALNYIKIFIHLLFFNAEQLVSFHAKPWRPHLFLPQTRYLLNKKGTHSSRGRIRGKFCNLKDLLFYSLTENSYHIESELCRAGEGARSKH